MKKIISFLFIFFFVFLLWNCNYNNPLSVNEKPVANAGNDTTVGLNDTINLYGTATDDGIIIKWEWKFGNSPWIETSNGDTSIITSSTAQVYVCSLRVTDDDGFTGVDVVAIGVGMDFMMDIDGNVYTAIKIGNQVWTVENLRTTKYNDGTPIPYVSCSQAWEDHDGPAYCYYDNTTDSVFRKKYGALYNWYVINTGKIAPKGWHVPTDEDWTELRDYLIANGYNWDGTKEGNKIAKSMAATTDWLISDTPGAIGNDLSVNNSSGFSALPGRYCDCEGESSSIGYSGHWWNATGASSLDYYRAGFYTGGGDVRSECMGRSVRLLRN